MTTNTKPSALIGCECSGVVSASPKTSDCTNDAHRGSHSQHPLARCFFCGYEYDEDCGCYGCPDCHGEGPDLGWQKENAKGTNLVVDANRERCQSSGAMKMTKPQSEALQFLKQGEYNIIPDDPTADPNKGEIVGEIHETGINLNTLDAMRSKGIISFDRGFIGGSVTNMKVNDSPPVKNKTGKKTLDRLNSDPRVKEVWDEGEEGIWVSLASGWNWDGCGAVHEHTAREIMWSMKGVQKGDPS